MGLFCGNVVLFLGNVGLLCGDMGLFFADVRLFYEDIRLFGGNVGLFCGDVGLLCGYIGLFRGDVGLFCRCVAGVLQVCCRCVACALQRVCNTLKSVRCSAAHCNMLQVCCRCVAGMLRVCCVCVAESVQYVEERMMLCNALQQIASLLPCVAGVLQVRSHRYARDEDIFTSAGFIQDSFGSIYGSFLLQRCVAVFAVCCSVLQRVAAACGYIRLFW